MSTLKRAVGNRLLGHDQAFLNDIAVDGGADEAVEFPGEVVFADEEFVGQEIQRQVVPVVLVDIGEDAVDHGIGGGIVFRQLALLQGKTVEHHQNLDQQGKGEDMLVWLRADGLLAQLLQIEAEQRTLGTVRAQQIGVAVAGGVEAGGKVLAGCAQVIQKAL